MVVDSGIKRRIGLDRVFTPFKNGVAAPQATAIVRVWKLCPIIGFGYPSLRERFTGYSVQITLYKVKVC
jgi:UDP-N-acetylglucosamine:LPS N-acetylglucosamine transferase